MQFELNEIEVECICLALRKGRDSLRDIGERFNEEESAPSIASLLEEKATETDDLIDKLECIDSHNG